jgi:hypothetical protein
MMSLPLVSHAAAALAGILWGVLGEATLRESVLMLFARGVVHL